MGPPKGSWEGPVCQPSSSCGGTVACTAVGGWEADTDNRTPLRCAEHRNLERDSHSFANHSLTLTRLTIPVIVNQELGCRR